MKKQLFIFTFILFPFLFFGQNKISTKKADHFPDRAMQNKTNAESCEWTIHLWTFETFGDEVTWELRNEEEVLLEGGPYEITFDETLSVTAEGPVEVYINTIGDNNDNEVNFTLANESGILIAEHVEGGEETTFSDFNCTDEGEPVEGDYCIPQLDCSDQDMITNVTFLDINNDSECSENGYGDYTDQTAEVAPGETYPIAVSVGGGWEVESVSVWIDFDQSETFEEEEFFYIGTGSDETLTAEIDIPEDIEDGEYRMRVRVAAVGENDATWDMACDTAEHLFGETEDYTITVGEMGIEDLSKTDFTFYPNPVNDLLNINTDSEIQAVKVFNLLGQEVLKAEEFADGKINTNSLTPAMYIVEIEFTEGQKERFKIIKE